MALTPQIRNTQTRVLTAINFPTEFLRATQVRVMIGAVNGVDMRVTQARILAAVKGRTENRHIRAWGFTLDEHDMWVIRLGESETLVYDDMTGEWYVWNGDGFSYWRAHQGFHWVGMGAPTYAAGAENNIVAGDDQLGILWQVIAGQGYDEDTGGNATRFTRIETGLLPMRLRSMQPCKGVYLTASMGEPAFADCTITLKISDDGGNTYWSAGSIMATDGDYNQEIAWRSLGLIRAPGRIFSLEDDGVAARIDGLDMVD